LTRRPVPATAAGGSSILSTVGRQSLERRRHRRRPRRLRPLARRSARYWQVRMGSGARRRAAAVRPSRRPPPQRLEPWSRGASPPLFVPQRDTTTIHSDSASSALPSARRGCAAGPTRPPRSSRGAFGDAKTTRSRPARPRRVHSTGCRLLAPRRGRAHAHRLRPEDLASPATGERPGLSAAPTLVGIRCPHRRPRGCSFAEPQRERHRIRPMVLSRSGPEEQQAVFERLFGQQ
jgi:hypothetical protein